MKTTHVARMTLLVAAGLCATASAATTPPAPADLMLAPGELDLGPRAPSTTTARTVWLINAGDQTLELGRAAASCGCTKVDLKPMTLPAHSALDVPLRVTAPRTPGKEKRVSVTFTFKDRAPLTLPIRIEAEAESPDAKPTVRGEVSDLDPLEVRHPFVEAVKRHLNQVHTGYRYDQYRVHGNTVTAIAWDADRLSPRARLICHVNDQGLVERTSFRTITPLERQNR